MNNHATYAAVVGDDADACLVQTDWHSCNETWHVFPNVVEISFLDWGRRVEDKVEVDAQIIGAAVLLAANWDISSPLAILTDAVRVVRNADL